MFSWLLGIGPAFAQTRIQILQAEDRRAPTPNDVALLRAGTRSDAAETRRIAFRALGRLERPALIPDIVPGLRQPLAEIRAEAANAIGQAAEGWKLGRTPSDGRALAAAVAVLVSRLRVEADADVRAAILETIGRMPYSTAGEVDQAERTIVGAGGATLTDRLGVAKGLEALGRISRKLRPGGQDAIALLRNLATGSTGDASSGSRVRRLAVAALIAADAVDEPTLARIAAYPDAQVRREAMQAAGGRGEGRAPAAAVLRKGLADPTPTVRLEALRALNTCDASVEATRDADMHVALLALDQLSACGASDGATMVLERTLDDLSDVGAPRGWHRAAHAIVALASAAPDRAAVRLPPFAISRVPQLRVYAARAASVLKDRATLERLASGDADDNVREAAIEALSRVAGHDADETYAANLSRPGYQAVRAAALALAGSPHRDRVAPALTAALQRLVKEGHDNSHDARAAIETALGRSDQGQTLGRPRADLGLTSEELRRLAAARARIAIRDVGTFEVALFSSVAPITVLKFVHLAEAGYYNGLTFHRVVANFVIQGGSPGANEYVGEPSFMRDEVGLWPHVRGAVGISTRGRDTGDAQIFVDLVDNPRLDHTYTVFGQVLNGLDVVDRILEGDVIDRIDIVP